MKQTSDLFSEQTNRVLDANELDLNACFERIVDKIVTVGLQHATTQFIITVYVLA